MTELIDKKTLITALRDKLEDVEYGMEAYGIEQAIEIIEDMETIKIKAK